MPALYTHNKFAKEVYNKLNKNNQNILKKELIYYKIFSQSFDNLYYYNILTLSKKSKKIRDLGYYAHKNNINLYFKNIILYIMGNNLNNNSLARAYLYGSINHYFLDSYIHPYVFYKTGVYNFKNKNSFKYNGLHAKLEFMLDAYFYNIDTNKYINNFPLHKNLIPKLKFPKLLKTMINEVFYKTFNFANIGNAFNKSYNQQHYIFKFIIQDRYGLKKKIYKLIDLVTTKKIKNIQNNSLHIKNIDLSILNLKKEKWFHPVNNIPSNLSLLEIYDKALHQSAKMLNKLDDVLNNKYDLEKFLQELGNNSYITGLPVEQKFIMKYFEI